MATTSISLTPAEIKDAVINYLVDVHGIAFNEEHLVFYAVEGENPHGKTAVKVSMTATKQ